LTTRVIVFLLETREMESSCAGLPYGKRL